MADGNVISFCLVFFADTLQEVMGQVISLSDPSAGADSPHVSPEAPSQLTSDEQPLLRGRQLMLTLTRKYQRQSWTTLRLPHASESGLVKQLRQGQRGKALIYMMDDIEQKYDQQSPVRGKNSQGCLKKEL